MNFADLLASLPRPSHLPVYKHSESAETLVHAHPGERSAANRPVHTNNVLLINDHENQPSYELTIASVNQPADRKILALPSDSAPKTQRTFPRPPLDEVDECIARTKDALESLVNVKIASRQPSAFNQRPFVSARASEQPDTQYLEYQSGEQERVVQIKQVPRDPLSPPRFKHKRAVPLPPSPPAPLLHSPPRKLTAAGYTAWRIPPSVSAWKNPKGYTIPLDKRLAADGRSLQEHFVNERFAQLTESLYVAEGQAREEVKLREEIAARLVAGEQQDKEARMLGMLGSTAGVERLLQRRSERMAADPGASEALFDPRLFDRSEGIASGMMDDEAYNLYDRPLLGQAGRGHASTTALVTGSTFLDADGTADPARLDTKAKRSDLEYEKLVAKDYSQSLQFSADVAASAESDPFGLDSFLSAAKNHRK